MLKEFQESSLYIFNKNLLYKSNVNLDFLIENFDDFKKLNKKEAQLMLEIHQMLHCWINYSDLLKNIKICIEKIPFKYLEKILWIFQEQTKQLNLSLDLKELCKEQLAMFLLQIFQNKFIIKTENMNLKKNNVNLYNTYDIINEFSRLLNNFFIFFNLEENLLPKNKKNIDLCFQILHLCEQNKIFIKKQSVKKNKKNYFFYINDSFHIFYVNLDLKINFILPTFKFFNNNLYMCGLHYLRVTEVFIKNKYSHKKFLLNDYNLVEKIKNTTYYFDKIMHNVVLDELKKVYNYKDNDEESFYNHVLKKYIQTQGWVSTPYNQRILSNHYYTLIFLKLANIDQLFCNKFYLHYYFDFRGRLYSDSIIAPGGHKIFRFLYNYGEYSSNEIEQITSSLYFKQKIFKYSELINTQCNLTYYYKNLKLDDIVIQEVVEQSFFELGKIDKSKILDEKNGKLSYDDFINLGINLFNKFKKSQFSKDLEFEKKIEILYILNMLEQYNKNIFVKSVIYKDSTASAIQLLMVLLKTDKIENLSICNLKNDEYWLDPYFYIIELFKKIYNNELSELSIKLFNRKNLKKTIMIFNYGAIIQTCWYDFCTHTNIWKTDKTNKEIKTNEVNNDYSNLYKDFQLFYVFLNNFFKNGTFFKYKIDELIDFFKKDINLIKIKKELKIIMSDKSESDLVYMESKKIRLDKIINETRITLELQQLLNEISEKATFNAFLPNLIQSLDATYLRIILYSLPNAIITIHDCFGIDVLNTHVLVEVANMSVNRLNFEKLSDYFKNPFNVSYQSKFVIL